jgi:hypothetical protein
MLAKLTVQPARQTANVLRRALCTAEDRRSKVRARIQEIDARAKGQSIPLSDGGSLTSSHSADELEQLCSTASVAELKTGLTGAGSRCFVLQHPDAPAARLAELWLLEPFPLGRFEMGLGGIGGTGPTMRGTATHSGLALTYAAPLVAHVVSSQLPVAVEAVASLPGLSAWIASLDVREIENGFGADAAEATMLVATRRHHHKLNLARPTTAQLNAAVLKARPAWEHYATRFAASSAAEEAALYRHAGGSDVGIALGADSTPAGLMTSGGAMALMAWPGEPALKVGE